MAIDASNFADISKSVADVVSTVARAANPDAFREDTSRRGVTEEVAVRRQEIALQRASQRAEQARKADEAKRAEEMRKLDDARRAAEEAARKADDDRRRLWTYGAVGVGAVAVVGVGAYVLSRK